MQFDHVNILAIDLLELLGNYCPNQGQINLAESLIIPLLLLTLRNKNQENFQPVAFNTFN